LSGANRKGSADEAEDDEGASEGSSAPHEKARGMGDKGESEIEIEV